MDFAERDGGKTGWLACSAFERFGALMRVVMVAMAEREWWKKGCEGNAARSGSRRAQSGG